MWHQLTIGLFGYDLRVKKKTRKEWKEMRLVAIWCLVFHLISLLLSIISRFTHLFRFLRFRLAFHKTFLRTFPSPSQHGECRKNWMSKCWTLCAIMLMKVERRAAGGCRMRVDVTRHICFAREHWHRTFPYELSLSTATRASQIDYFDPCRLFSLRRSTPRFFENWNWFRSCRRIFRVKIITCFRLPCHGKESLRKKFLRRKPFMIN